MGKTSAQWWAETKGDPKKFNGWLIRQYRGEATAARRISDFAEQYAPNTHQKNVLKVIASQEAQHATWVLQLLKARGIEPDVSSAEKRYWKETLPSITSFVTGAAVGAHAEAMRLERIRVIAADDTAPEDVQRTFARILSDEIFHERAFRDMAGPEAMKSTLDSHKQGRNSLGLEP